MNEILIYSFVAYAVSLAIVCARLVECREIVADENTRQKVSTLVLTVVPVVNTVIAMIVVYLWITEHADRTGRA